MRPNPKFRFIDLFAGIGGFHLALEKLGGSCEFASEIDDRARAVYHDNFGIMPVGDIRDITGPNKNDDMIDWMIPDHNILAGGFPCQPFSLAGVSSRNSLGREHGLLDKTKGTLFFDICRIAKIKQPDVIFLENVKNLKTHDSGQTFEVIRSTIEKELGYKFYADVLNSESLTGQRRRRLFIVAFKDRGRNFSFPKLDGPPIPLKAILEANVDDKFTISDRAWAGHQRRTKANKLKGNGFSAFEADLDKPSNTLVARYYKDGKECLIPQPGKNPRMLTPRECARLQGFPEDYIMHKSKSAAYKQFGNAVTVPVVERIAENILISLGLSNGRQPDTGTSLQKHGGDKRQEHQA